MSSDKITNFNHHLW